MLVGFDADFDAAGLCEEGGFAEGVFHEDEILGFGGPGWLGSLIGVDDWCATFSGEADGLFEVLGSDFGFAEWGMCGESGEFDAGFLAGAFDAIGVVEHGDAVEVTGFGEEFAAPVDHGLAVLIAELGGFFDAPLEGFVIVSDEFHVDADEDISHV